MEFHDQKDKTTVNHRMECTLDGTVNRHGQPAVRDATGNWFAGNLLLCMSKKTKIALLFFFH